MAFSIDFDAVIAAVDELSRGAHTSRGEFLLDYGLSLHATLDRWTYSSTPVNSATFASTGGDGVHFGFLSGRTASASIRPVVMTVPMAEPANHIVAESIGEFLELGCIHGWSSLEQLAYRPTYTFELYAHAGPPRELRISQLFNKLSLKSRRLEPERLELLSRKYAALIALVPPEAIPASAPIDLEAFLAWKHSKYGE